MGSFPLLSTSAVVQYSVGISTIQESRVIHFIDGADQRYLAKKRPMRSWQVKLELLNETEMLALEIFFSEQMGIYSTFSFTDPYTGTIVPNCRLANGLLTSEFLGVDNCRTTITVIETNG
jgi:hypothetical protein